MSSGPHPPRPERPARSAAPAGSARAIRRPGCGARGSRTTSAGHRGRRVGCAPSGRAPARGTRRTPRASIQFPGRCAPARRSPLPDRGRRRRWGQGDAPQRVGGQIRQRGIAVDGHEQIGLGQQRSEDVHDAVSAAEREPVGVRPADADGRRAQGERLDDVVPAAHTGVEQHRWSRRPRPPGQQSMAGMPPFAWRPPWLEQ